MNHTTILPNNYRRRFLFDHASVRGLHVHLSEVWRHIVSQKSYPRPIQTALGELLAAAALLSENLKFEGTLTVQVQGSGVLKLLVAEAALGQTVRATARWDQRVEVDQDADLRALLGSDGVFAITVQPKEGEPWQGIVPLEGGSIADMLMAYMSRSEQVQTLIALAADDHRVGGVLLQKLPEEHIDEEAWTHLSTLAQTLNKDELLCLETEQLLYRLFHETPPRVFPAEVLEFACTCSRAKVSDMLLLLGGEEVGKTVIEEGSIAIDCDFCNERYAFDEADVHALFGMDVVSALRTVQNVIQ